jgi:hypothetical protein
MQRTPQHFERAISRLSDVFGRSTLPQMSLRRVPMHTLLVTAALTLAACGENETLRSDSTGSSEAKSTASGFTGTYEMTLAEGGGTEAPGAPPGRWLITLSAGEAYLDGPSDAHIALQPEKLSEVRVVFPAIPACPNNDPAPGKGIYDVHLTGDDLEFVKRRDPCGYRGFILARRWHRVPSS